MSHYRSDSAVAGPSSDRDVPTSPSAQPTPASPTQGPSPIQGSSKDNALSEKYKKLKRRFFELEEETSTELQRSSERNVRMREERNMLLDRIIELEAQSQLQNEEGGSPTSPSFPRTLMSARAHDDVDPAPTSRHLDSQARRKSDDDRREEEAREAKKSTRRSRALNSSSPKGKEGDSDAVAVSPRLYSAHEEPCQISDPLPDVMDAQHECRATSGDPATLDTSLSTSPDSSVPPIQLEIQSQSPVQKPDVLLHVDSSNVDQQGSERPSDRTASSIDGSAVTDVVMADGTSRAANGHTVSPPADGTNAEVSFGPGIPVDDVTKTSSNQQREADSENMDVVPPEDGNEAIPQGKTRGKGATTRGTRGKKTKKLIRAEAECSQMSRRSARLARSTEVPSKSGVRTQQALDGNVKQPTHATRSQTPASIYARTLSPSHAFEDNISAASPPPPSDVPESGTLIESPSPSPTTNDLQGHILDVIDPLLKHSGIPSVSSPSLSSASASHQLDNTSVPSMDSIVMVATAAIAAQNAARASSSATQNSDTSTTPKSASPVTPAPAQGTPTGAERDAGPSPISNNPYLALSAVKPGGSPIGMPPMMPPINPYSMYYPAPGVPGALPYPYVNPYYYMSPMAGPSTIYSPPPTNNSPPPSTPRPPLDTQRQAKPKRLKAHTVTSKQFSIPMVPRDKNGKPMLPLNVGIMTVINLGTVCMREHFHTERYIFPVGYEVTRRYMSTIDPNHDVVYHCTILDGGDGPKFQIIPADAPDRPVIAGTATGAWSTIVKQANAIRNRQHSNSVSGPDFFGLGQNTIKHLIQQLPNADRLRDYVWQHFVEGGPLGGRHAAVIPALPDEYENILPIGALQYHEEQKTVGPPPDPSRGLSYYPQHIIQQAQQQRKQPQQQGQRQQPQQ